MSMFKFTCMCGHVYHHVFENEKWRCTCGADLSIRRKPHAIQPIVTLPDGANLSQYLAKAKHMRAQLEFEKKHKGF